MTYNELFAALCAAGIGDDSECRREAALLAEHFGGIRASELPYRRNEDMESLALQSALERRINREPLQYIFGNLCKYNFQNFHNGVLTIFSSLGIIGIVWTIWMWNICLRNIEKTSKSKYQKLAYFFVLLFLLDSVSESMTMVGTIPQGLFVYLMVKIARGEVVLNSTDLNSEPESFAQERKLYDRTSTD